MNQLQAIAMNEGLRLRKALWRKSGRAKLESLQLAPWAARRRKDLLELLDRLTPKIEELNVAVEAEAWERPEVHRLMTHPGVGPITALAFVLIIGTPERFRCGKQIGSYVGLIPCEDSSGGRQRLGHISKQGNSLLRFLLVEAAHSAAREDAEWKRRYLPCKSDARVPAPNEWSRITSTVITLFRQRVRRGMDLPILTDAIRDSGNPASWSRNPLGRARPPRECRRPE